MKLATAGLVIAFVCSPLLATTPSQRTLIFEDRVKAQAAIERVYYSHQLGATKKFEDAVPKAVLENKVRQYLEQTAALSVYWKTAVTDEMLQRELERIAQGTRMPERLVELYSALGNDPFIVKECLARATLVDRLTRNFYAFDSTMHVKAKAQAEELHRQLVLGELSPLTDTVRRTIRERRAERPTHVGQVSDVRESRDEFAFSVTLRETANEARVANYAIPKTSWDAWWKEARLKAPGESVAVVASTSGSPKTPTQIRSVAAGSSKDSACVPDDSWDNGSLYGGPDAGEGHTAVWTGSLMLIWGGSVNGGGRYDPAIDTWTEMATTGAPSDGTAFWTGNRMVVWGNSSGGRYDPATDTWAPMSTIGARYGSSAVWSGSELIVWGGVSGGRYDPANDTWSPMSVTGAPFGRYDRTVIWAGNVMIVWNGDTGGRYDPVNDTWTPMSTAVAPAGCESSTAVWTGSLMVVWCSYSTSENPGESFNQGGRYDPVADTWTPMSPDGHISRGGYSAIWTGSRVIFWGGFNRRRFLAHPPRALSNGAQYDPVTDTWTGMSDGPRGSSGHTAVWTGSLMVVWGGDGGESGGGALNTGGRYAPVTDSWTSTSTEAPSAPSTRADHSAVWTGSLLVVWGGHGAGYPYDLLDTGGRYDPTTDSWTPTSTTNAPTARSGHTAVWTGSEMIVWGGESNLTGGRYDPGSDSWTSIATTGAPPASDYHTAVWTGSMMVVWGGYSSGDGPVNTGARYDPATDLWTPTSTEGAPLSGYYHTAVWAGSVMVVWGSGDSGVGTGGRYDPSTDSWTPMSATDSPPAYEGYSAVWTGSLMVVWGGSDDGGGRYDPLTDAWMPISSTGAPYCPRSHTAIWTGTVLVFWGGSYDIEGVNTGGRYDPAADTWTPTSTTRAPSARLGHTAVWTGSLMLVWGGHSRTYRGDDLYVNTGGRYRVATSPYDDRDCDGLSASEGDCDDTRPTVNPAAPQSCDGLNNDCNDPAWPAVPQNETNSDGDAFSLCAGDCDDTRGWIFPGAPENCNASDDDCDGIVDNGGDVLCYDDNVCTDDTCHGAAGCAVVANSNVCDDSNPCTNNDSCQYGYCEGTPRDCDDGNTCTDDWCDWLTGCYHYPNYSPCDDGNPCTWGDTCQQGACRDGAFDACDDGDACTTGDRCEAGACVAATGTLDCHDDNPCTTDFCNPYMGCVFADDSSLCNDHNPCTDDTCDPAKGCMFINAGNPCTDGNACTSGDWCNDGVCIAGTPEVCHDNNPCTNDACNPATGCFFPSNTSPCSDSNACTKGDICGGGTCHPGGLGVCNDFNPCTTDSCNPTTGCVFANNNIACSDGNACTTSDFCGGGSCHSGGSRECNDDNPCTTDACNPATGCVFTNNTNACDDHLVCTEGDTCHGGVCRGTSLNCTDKNVCTNDSCDPTNGCVHTNNAAPCNDGNACTRTDACSAGVCVGESPVGCEALDQCHDAGVCDPGTGTCSNPNKANGTVCDDSSPCTNGETCQSGSCTPAFSGLNHPAPKSAGYYKKLCEKREHNQLPYQGDQLTDADAACVGQLTATFAGIARIDDICDVVHKDRHGGRHHGGPGGGPDGKDCDKGENELIATAINLCRARVCEAQNLESQCRANTHTTVGQSLADAADAILDNAARDKDTCKRATCELREINNGHALELNSLVLALENGKVRLNWSSPVLDDGSGTPSSYEVWRRPMGSNDAFVKLGTTAGLTFLDLTAGTSAWEYDITAVIPGD